MSNLEVCPETSIPWKSNSPRKEVFRWRSIHLQEAGVGHTHLLKDVGNVVKKYWLILLNPSSQAAFVYPNKQSVARNVEFSYSGGEKTSASNSIVTNQGDFCVEEMEGLSRSCSTVWGDQVEMRKGSHHGAQEEVCDLWEVLGNSTEVGRWQKII